MGVRVAKFMHNSETGNIYLESDVVTDVAHFDLVLIHCADVWLHLYDTSG